MYSANFHWHATSKHSCKNQHFIIYKQTKVELSLRYEAHCATHWRVMDKKLCSLHSLAFHSFSWAKRKSSHRTQQQQHILGKTNHSLCESRDKHLPDRHLFLFSRLFPGNRHAFGVLTREMWLFTWAEVWQWCTDSDDTGPLTPEIKAVHGVLNTHSVVRNDPVLFYAWLLTSQPDGWGRGRGGGERCRNRECACRGEMLPLWLGVDVRPKLTVCDFFQ